VHDLIKFLQRRMQYVPILNSSRLSIVIEVTSAGVGGTMGGGHDSPKEHDGCELH
jgi:hypothetical protein